jgi:dipeptidyl aminopeptidase/acylaminoacyl peptidase
LAEAALAAVAGLIVFRILSASGATPDRIPESQLAWFDRTGLGEGSLRVPGKAVDPRLSPGGGAVLCNVLAPGRSSLWSIPLGGEAPTQLTPDTVSASGAVWSPDGGRVAYVVSPGGRVQIRRNAPVPETVEVAAGDPENSNLFTEDWAAPDRLLCARFFLSARRGLWILRADRRADPEFLAAAGENAYEGRFSPDGRWIVFTTMDSGQEEVRVVGVSGREQRRVSLSGGHSPQWSHSGEEIYYIDRDGFLIAAPWKNDAAGQPVRLFALPARDSNAEFGYWFGGYAPDPQGRRFLVVLEKNAVRR